MLQDSAHQHTPASPPGTAGNGHQAGSLNGYHAGGYPDIPTPVVTSGELSPEDRAALAEGSAISDEAITARGYFTAQGHETLSRLGFARLQCLPPALVIPLYNWRGERAGYAIRPRIPRNGKNGKPIKYEVPAGSTPVLDVAPLTAAGIDDPQQPLIITEGAKKADAAASRGLVAINLNGVYGFRGRNAKGGMTALPDWNNVALKGRAVYVAFDSDAQSNPRVAGALHQLCPFLQSRGAVVKVVYLPAGPNGSKTGLDDYLAGGGTVAELLSLARDLEPVAESRRKAKADKLKADMAAVQAAGLPVIETNNRQMRDELEDLGAAIERANATAPHLFHGDAGLTVVGADKKGNPVLQKAKREVIQVEASRAATWISTTEREGVRSVAPPRDLCAAYLTSSDDWHGIPVIDGIATAPVVAPDGSVCAVSGYHAAARLWVSPPAGFFLPDINPTPGNVAGAKALLCDDLLGEVAFADEASRAHAVALMILPFVRLLVHGPTPLHLFDAPTQSSGKSYAAEVCIAPFTPPVASVEKADDEEWRKALLAALMSGRSHIFLDNIKGRLASPMLAAAVSAPTGSICERGLGGLEEVNATVRCVWVATSNNATLAPDTASRCVVIRLDTGQEDPESRIYDRNPLHFIRENRAQVAGAILTLVRHWQEQGCPNYAGPHQTRFPAWQSILGGIISAAGIPGFLDNLNVYRSALNPEKVAWGCFVEAWQEKHGENFVTASDLLPLALELPEIAATLGDKEGRPQCQRLGRQLQVRRDKVYNGLKITAGITGRNGATYRVCGSGGSGGSPHSVTRKVPNERLIHNTPNTPLDNHLSHNEVGIPATPATSASNPSASPAELAESEDF